MKKRLLSFCLTLVLITSCLGITGVANSVYGLEKSPASSISCGLGMTTVLKNDGTVWIWGSNDYSDFGLKSKLKPTQVEGIDDIIAVSVGWDNAIALKNNGTVWSWGKDIEDAARSVTPVKMEGLTDIIAVSTNLAGSLALKKDGTVWSWDTWISGDGTKETRNTPVMVPNLKDVVSISMGMNSAFIVKKDGTVWGWGDNYYGKLGNGSTMNQYSPVQVQGLSDIKCVAAGDTHALALKKDGTVWGWGYNVLGELARSEMGYTNMPAQIDSMKGVVAVSAGCSYSTALLSDGTIQVWGDNGYGQFGNGSSSEDVGYSPSPVSVDSLSDVVAVTAGNQHLLALQKDGSLWIWGDYEGTYEEHSKPTKVSINLGDQKLSVPSDTTASAQAVPTKSKVLVNGKEIGFEAYNINGSNYFKLRDIAMSVNGTRSQFEVSWDKEKNAIDLLTKKAYTTTGGELSPLKSAVTKNALLSSSKIYVDGKVAGLTAYNISGSNYFKLRDLGDVLGFNVLWDAAQNAIKIETL